MGRDDDSQPSNVVYMPSFLDRIDAKSAELEAAIAAGTMTREAAGVALAAFKSHLSTDGSGHVADLSRS